MPDILADEACCAKLAAINFQSNLPIVIADTNGVTPSRKKEPTKLCTCSTGLHKGDVEANVDFKVRGGTNSRATLESSSRPEEPRKRPFTADDPKTESAACSVERRNQIFQFGFSFKSPKWFLGMPKSKNWILYAQQLDPIGLHNWLGFNLTRATGAYAARAHFLEARH